MTGRVDFTSTSALVKANLLVAFGMFLFSISLPILQELLQRYSVTSVAGLRNIGAGGFLIALGMMVEPRSQMTWARIKKALFAGGVWYLITMLCLTYAVAFVGAFSTAVILSLIPVVSAIINVATKQDKIGPRLSLALVLSIAGGIIASVGFSAEGFSLGWGEAVMMVGIVTWVLMTRSVDHHLNDAPQLISIGIVIFTPGVILSIAAIALEVTGIEQSGLSWALTPFDWMLLVVLAIISSAGSMVLWFKSVDLLGITIASLQQNLVPVFVLAQVWWIGQQPELIKIMGGVLVIAGAVVAQMRMLRPAGLKKR